MYENDTRMDLFIYFHVFHVIIDLWMYENITYKIDYQKQKKTPYPRIYIVVYNQDMAILNFSNIL